MINNKIISLVFKGVYLPFGLIGMLYGIYKFKPEFTFQNFLYFTELSNLLGFICMIIVFIYTFKDILKKDYEGFNNRIIPIKFCATLALLATFLIFNFIIYPDFLIDKHKIYTQMDKFYPSINNLTLHLICPIMVVLDFFLFDKKETIKKHYTFYILIFPTIYSIFILTRAQILLHLDPNARLHHLVYPYFFLDPKEMNGIVNVILSIIATMSIFYGISWLFYMYNNKTLKKEKYKKEV